MQLPRKMKQTVVELLLTQNGSLSKIQPSEQVGDLMLQSKITHLKTKTTYYKIILSFSDSKN